MNAQNWECKIGHLKGVFSLRSSRQPKRSYRLFGHLPSCLQGRSSKRALEQTKAWANERSNKRMLVHIGVSELRLKQTGVMTCFDLCLLSKRPTWHKKWRDLERMGCSKIQVGDRISRSDHGNGTFVACLCIILWELSKNTSKSQIWDIVISAEMCVLVCCLAWRNSHGIEQNK